MADILPFPDREERDRRAAEKAYRAELEAEYAAGGVVVEDEEEGVVAWHDVDPVMRDASRALGCEVAPLAPLLEALIELMETDTEPTGPSVA